eukprot:7872630-Alexandrium_andersonii.AAC.1
MRVLHAMGRCDGADGTAVRAFIKCVHRLLIPGCSGSVRHAKHARAYSNYNEAVHYAFAWLRGAPYKAIPTDKDGGFALVRTSDLRQLMEEKLNSPAYEECPRFAMDPVAMIAPLR